MGKPRMFIGSTVEGLSVAQAVQAELDHDFEITLWNQALFRAGTSTWLELVSKARSGGFDVALLVLGGEDQITSRGVTQSAPRDNVLLEFGLFTGALGADKTFFLLNRDHKPKIASDLAGICALTYGDRSDQNYHGAVGAACTALRQAVKLTGTLEAPTAPKKHSLTITPKGPAINTLTQSVAYVGWCGSVIGTNWGDYHCASFSRIAAGW